MIVPLGSGGTAAGLAAGIKLFGLRRRLVCVLVNDLIRVDATTVARLARRTLRLLGRHGVDVDGLDVTPADIAVERDWLGRGYGHGTAEAARAMDLFAKREGVTLEPVYTGKAMAALLELNRRSAFGDGPVLYWHTYKEATAGASDEVAIGAAYGLPPGNTPGPAGGGREAEQARITGSLRRPGARPAEPDSEAEEAAG